MGVVVTVGTGVTVGEGVTVGRMKLHKAGRNSLLSPKAALVVLAEGVLMTGVDFVTGSEGTTVAATAAGLICKGWPEKVEMPKKVMEIIVTNTKVIFTNIGNLSFCPFIFIPVNLQ